MTSRTIRSLILLAAISGCSGPGDDLLDRDYRYWVCVSNEHSGDLTILDGDSRAKVATIPLGKRARAIHPSPDGKSLYVALGEGPAGGIGVVDLAARRLVRTIPLGADPSEFAVSLDGSRLFVSNRVAGTVSVVEVSSGTIRHVVPVGEGPEGVAFAPDGQVVYVACGGAGEVLVLDQDDGSVRKRLTVGGNPRSVAFLPDGSRAYIPSESTGQLRVLDTLAGKVRATVALPRGSSPLGILTTEDGRRVCVANGQSGTVTVHDRRGALLHVVRVGTRPWALALSPDNETLYTANGPGNDVSVVDMEAYREIARVPAGQGPWGIAVVRAPSPTAAR